MKTKNIFKALALAMLMPAMLLTTACSNEDDFVNNTANTENTINKGYALPVTVNVTRQGDAATRATYNESTGKLAFSAGDKLFVYGNYNLGKKYAGTLDYVPATGKFSGTIYTQNEWENSADALFSSAESKYATLLPAGYDSYNFLSIDNNGTTEVAYDDRLSISRANAFAASATAKATGVEQFSYERAGSSDGFALAPRYAVLNFTISGLTAGAKDVTLKVTDGNAYSVTGSVTPNASGVATFAVGVPDYTKMQDVANNLTVGSSNFTLPSSSYFYKGKIYNITRAVPLPGVFTVSAGKTVQFSPGNLRYVSGAWSFFDHQYDYYATYSADAWDKFGWSNSTNNFGMSTSTVNDDYQGDLVEWGTVPGIGTGWFTLSNDEWGYLFNTRSASTVNSVADARYAKGKVNEVYGIILFPDTYTHPTGVTLPVGINDVGDTGWNGNNYSAADWTAMEAAGCVFLPATGYRNGASVQTAGSSCSYRSSSRNTSTTDMVYYVYFNSSSLTVSASNYGRYGQCVRLVCNAN